MPVRQAAGECRVLVARETAAEIECPGCDPVIDVRLPFTDKGFRILQGSREGQHVSVRSADGAYFIGEITDIDADRYVITVELS